MISYAVLLKFLKAGDCKTGFGCFGHAETTHRIPSFAQKYWFYIGFGHVGLQKCCSVSTWPSKVMILLCFLKVWACKQCLGCFGPVHTTLRIPSFSFKSCAQACTGQAHSPSHHPAPTSNPLCTPPPPPPGTTAPSPPLPHTKLILASGEGEWRWGGVVGRWGGVEVGELWGEDVYRGQVGGLGGVL